MRYFKSALGIILILFIMLPMISSVTAQTAASSENKADKAAKRSQLQYDAYLHLLVMTKSTAAQAAKSANGSGLATEANDDKCTPNKPDPDPGKPDPCKTKPCMGPQTEPKEPPHSPGPWDDEYFLNGEKDPVGEANANFNGLKPNPNFRPAPGWAQPKIYKCIPKGGPPKRKIH